jgi:hypothetical protein
MARVVQPRTPPYLAIVLALLFVIATVMAVLFFTRYNTAKKGLDSARTQRDRLANSDQLRRPDVKEMVEEYRKSRGGLQKTVVGQLSDQISQLADAITGMPSTPFLDAKSEIEKTFEEVKPPVRRGLVQHMVDFHKRLAVKDNEIATLQADKTKLQDDLAKAKKDLADAQGDFATKSGQKDQEIASLLQKFQKFEESHTQSLALAKKEYQDSADQISKRAKAQDDEIRTLTRDRNKWKTKYENLYRTKVGTPLDTAKVYRRPDGEIRQVLSEEGLVYLNIGAKDHVTEDLRFTVYPYTGIPDSGAGKAVIEVTNVSGNVSECRIIEQTKDNPIIAGDLVANVVYDALRTYGFIVEGAFDVNNTGDPTMAGNKAIKDLVRRYGGRIMKEVSIDTDYVILGDAPARPRKPDDTDAPGVWNLYNERLKAFNRYREVEDQAKRLQIPRLGGKRFLDLVGYVPAKAEATE